MGVGGDSHFFVVLCLLFICEICGVTSFGFDLRRRAGTCCEILTMCSEICTKLKDWKLR